MTDRLERAQKCDDADELRECRDWFELPDGVVYLDGNSLGPTLRSLASRMADVVTREWGDGLIRSWNQGWIDLPRQVGARIAPLIGAEPANVVCTDTVSLNLFKVLAAALALRPGRRQVLSATGTFPTDLYMVQGLGDLVGEERVTLALRDERDIAQHLDGDTAVVLLSHVNFRDGVLLDVRELTQAAHAAGALVIWDVSHSVGVVPIELAAWDVDFAVGCGYKFLNGGPGAPAFVYVAPQHITNVRQPLSGWMGHRDPFAFDPGYVPADGIDRMLSGTPSILGMSALDEALSVWERVTIGAVRRKSLALTSFFLDGVAASTELREFTVVTPTTEARGSQVSLRNENAFPVSQALIERGFVCDFREPDLVRFGFAPLFNSFSEVAATLAALEDIVATGAHREPRFSVRARVT